MGTQRTSNKEILEAINALTAAITAAHTAAPAQVAPAPEVKAEREAAVNVPATYMTHMQDKASAWAKQKGENVVLYARRNSNDETKLAYALKSRFLRLKDKGFIGAIAEYTA